MDNIFTKHPKAMNESYSEHFVCAVRFGVTMLIGGMACIIHAFFPFLFQKTGSNLLIAMTERFINRSPDVEDRFVVLSESIAKKNSA